MPAYYWIEFYVNPKEMRSDKVVEGTIKGLLDSGCNYKEVEIFTIPRGKQFFTTERNHVDLTEAKELAIKDLDCWVTGSHGAQRYPAIRLVFEYDFKFDEPVEEEVKEVTVDFWYSDFWDFTDRKIGHKINIHMHTWEEYVLMYGDKETHRINMAKILDIMKKVYENTEPYFGWADGEGDSWDKSFELLLNGELPVGNEFVFVGKKIIDKLDMEKLKRSGNFWESLSDGGILIDSDPKSCGHLKIIRL